MKKLFLLAAFSIAILSCNTQRSPQGNINVSGTIKGLKKGTLYLQQIQDTLIVNLDSIQLSGNGAFALAADIDETDLLLLHLDREDENEYNDRIRLFVQPGDQLTVNTSWDKFEYDAQISGSTSQSLYQDFQKMMNKFNAKNLSLIQEAIAYNQEGNQKAMDSVQALNNKNELRRYLFAINYAINHKDNPIAPYIGAIEIPDTNPVFLDSIYNSLDQPIADSKYGKELRSLLDAVKE